VRTRSHKPGRSALWLALFALGSTLVAFPSELASLRADRAAVERVYYNHRLGEKASFEQALPTAMLDELVRQDLRKEAALKNTYRVEVTPAMLTAEVQRINTTTRAPDILAEIKAALDNDPARFADVFAKPILVERVLREKFDNDDALHAPQRRVVEKVREQLRAARHRQGDDVPADKSVARLLALLKQNHSNQVTEMKWQLGARPAETNASGAEEIEIKKRFGPNAQMLSSRSAGGKNQEFYFEDLPGELQNVLRVQLRRPGDVSAVIEMPGGFLLYLAKEKNDATLSVATLSVPKRSYETWLSEQNVNF
jgi:hypothetical protein